MNKKPRLPKTQERELTIEDAISEAMAEIQGLAEEMREAFDNTPESLQQSSVGEARGEAADNLENISEPDVPAELQGDKFKMKWLVQILSPSAQRKQSRSDRRHEAVQTLNAVVEHLEDVQEENPDKKYTKEECEAASSLLDEIMQVIDEAEAVDFPGRYG